MAEQGPLFPGTVASVEETGDDNTWDNPGNVAADDGAEASVTVASFDTGDQTWALRSSNFDGTGFAVPAGAAIDGVKVEFQRRRMEGAGTATDHQVQLFSAPGTVIGENKATLDAWTNTPTTVVYGGITDVWTATLTDTIVNDPGFGVQIKAIATSSNTDVAIDFVRMTIYFTEAGGGEGSTGSGSPVATLSETASGTVIQTFSGSGTPVATLAATASGTAVQKFSGSGAPVDTLSATASGTAAQTFRGSGSPAKTLSAVASGTATNTPDVGDGSAIGSGNPVATLSAFATGTMVNTAPFRRRVRGVWIDEEKEEEPLELGLQETPAFEIPARPELEFVPLPALYRSTLREFVAPRYAKPPVIWHHPPDPEQQRREQKRKRNRKQRAQLVQMIMAGAA